MLELQQLDSVCLISGGQVKQPFDCVVLDGKRIGKCYRYENVIHWDVPKESLPPAIIQQAIWLLQSRNLEHAQQRLRVAR
jgi:hypothetical protein